MDMQKLTIAERLAEFAEKIEYKILSKSVIEQAKRSILDTLGVMIAGYNTKISSHFLSLANEWGGLNEATIIGEGIKVPAPNAALVNGTMGHIHELDDGHRFALGHPGVTTIPAVIAAAEKIGANGTELITATVLGYDIFVRIAMAVNPTHRSKGFHTTGTCGTFGAAIGSGKILKLEKKELVNSLGIAGIHVAGLMEVMRGESIIKPLNAGRASSDGLLASLLAKRGVTSPNTIIEGDNGFCRAYSDRYDLSKITNGLGDYYHIEDTYFKLHAACRHAHPAIDCALNILREYQFEHEDIENIIVKTYSAAYDLTGKEYQPKTISTAKFSLPYCIAVALTYGKVGIDEFVMDKISNNRLLELAKKVKVEIDPEIDKLAPKYRGASIKILSKTGTFEWTVKNPKGEPENPVSEEELENKFRMLSSPVIGCSRVDEIIKKVRRLQDLKEISILTDLLSSKQ